MIVAKKCLEYMKNNVINFNLVHTHFLENGLIGTVLKEEYNAPLIITGHGGDVYDVPFRSKWYNNISRYIISNANEVITVSNYNADKLLKLGASKKHLHVIPNGYSDMFKPTSKRNTRSILKLPSNKKILLSVGNLVKIKGYTYLLDAMYKLCKIRKDVILIVIGSGYLKNDLEKKVKLLGLTHNVNFIGPKKHEEIPLWMNSCDLFILPSLAEGFPTVIPEALACGKPVIASSVGGIPEIINSSVGLLIQPKNIDLLSDAIVQGIDKVWNYDFITSYSSRYSWKVLANNLLQVYNLYL
jgi:glycosyltransferase involved in cell wall biosynthesis